MILAAAPTADSNRRAGLLSLIRFYSVLVALQIKLAAGLSLSPQKVAPRQRL
jgi:hypothetical protein